MINISQNEFDDFIQHNSKIEKRYPAESVNPKRE
jgi:hypothetical protein